MPTDVPAPKSRILNAFRKWDSDGDGFIDEGDLRKVLSSVGMSKQNVESTFLCMDVNRDGRVDYTDFVNWMDASASPSHALVRERAMMEGAFGDSRAPAVKLDRESLQKQASSTSSTRGPARSRKENDSADKLKTGKQTKEDAQKECISTERLVLQECYNSVVEVRHPLAEILDLHPSPHLDRAEALPQHDDPAKAAMEWLKDKPHRDWEKTSVIVLADEDLEAAESVALTLQKHVAQVKLCPNRSSFIETYPWLKIVRESSADPVRRAHLLWRMWPSEVVPDFFFLGSLGIVTVQWLEAMKISHVLTALTDEDFDAACKEADAEEVFSSKQFSIHRAVLDDAADADLMSLLSGCCKFLYDAHSAGARVLVHCGGGVSRSPAIAAAFLIHRDGMSYDEALDFVKKHRSWVRTDRFSSQLKLWSSLCKSVRPKLPSREHVLKAQSSKP